MNRFKISKCPHEMACPRLLEANKTPCNFYVNYRTPNIGQTTKDSTILFSYVIFKKGSRTDDKTLDWPRMVRPTQVRSKHTRCKFCTHRGKLEEIVITKGKHSKYGDWRNLFSQKNQLIFHFFVIDILTGVLEKVNGAIECQLNLMKMNIVLQLRQIVQTENYE